MAENKSRENDIKKDKITVFAAMDVYLPMMDGVINCMRSYLVHYPAEVNRFAGCPKPGRELDEPYPIIYYKAFKIPFTNIYFGFPRYDRKFKEQLMKMDIDIIHVHAPFGVCKLLTKIAKEKNIPIVSHVHTNYKEVFRKILRLPFLYKPYIKKLGKRYAAMDVMFAGTQATERLLRRDFDYTGECSIVPFGTNLVPPKDIAPLKKKADELFGLNENEFVFCTVSRIVHSKRIQFSIDALAEAKKHGYRFKFIIGGTGNYLAPLKEKVKHLGMENDVIFTGYVDEDTLAAIYARADMFLFPSVQDTFGLVKVEAAAFRTPGVFIKGCDAAYGTEDSVNCFQIEDNLEDFVKCVEKCIDNRAFVAEMGENALNDLYFSWHDSANQITDEYRRIIAEHKRKYGDKR